MRWGRPRMYTSASYSFYMIESPLEHPDDPFKKREASSVSTPSSYYYSQKTMRTRARDIGSPKKRDAEVLTEVSQRCQPTQDDCAVTAEGDDFFDVFFVEGEEEKAAWKGLDDMHIDEQPFLEE